MYIYTHTHVFSFFREKNMSNMQKYFHYLPRWISKYRANGTEEWLARLKLFAVLPWQ